VLLIQTSNLRPFVLIHYRLIKIMIRLSLIFLFIQIAFCTQAQDISDVKISGRYGGLSATEFFNQVSDNYGIRFFYKAEWVDTITIHRDFDQTPLVQALNSIFQNRDITWRIFQDHSIILFPIPESDRQKYVDALQLLVIGNPLNEGRYKTAVLEGRIVDGKTGDPLPGAVILDVRNNKGSSTDRGGYFTMELPTGEHQLQFSYLGYQPVNQRIRLIENGYAEIEIFEESHNIAEVTVKGESADLPKAQMSMIRMEVRKIKDLPALMGEVDVMRGMTMQAGVQSVSELSSGFNVRGGNTDQNLLLINGSPVFNSSHLFGFLSLINPDLVDNVRMFKGGMPARYGERVASVMEVELKDGNTEAMRVSGGLGIINSRLAFDGPVSGNKKLTLNMGGRSSYTNWILREIPNPDISQSTTGFYDIAGKLTYRFNPHNRISGMGYYSHDEFSTSANTIMKYGSLLAGVQVRNRLSEKMTAEGGISFSQYDYLLTDMAKDVEELAYDLSNRMQYGAFKYNVRYRPDERHTLEAGVNLVGYRIDPGEVRGVFNPSLIANQKLDEEKALEWAGYMGDDFAITPQLSVSAGLRYSGFSAMGSPVVYLYDPDRPKSPQSVVDSLQFDPGEVVKTYGNIEPRVMIRYELPAGSAFKLNLQRISQYVFQISNNAVISPAESWKMSDYHLEPLISDQIAIGYERLALKQQFELTLEAYYKKLQNLIEYKNGAQLLMNPHVETSLIPSDGYSAGIELQARKNYGRLTGWVNYTFSRTMRRTNSEREEEKLWDGEYYPSIYDKPHDFSMVATYNISRRWRFTGNFVYVSGRPVTLPELQYSYAGESLIYYSERNKYRMPSYHRLDVSITLDENLRKKRMWKGSWTLSVYNLYGRNNPYSVYYRKTMPTIDNGYRLYSLFKLSVIGVPIPSLTYNFKF
jgi:hypothetical protein